MASNDNTTLNGGAGGDVISTEDMAVGALRGTDAVPTTDYKLPRSKIAIGQYGVDKGDASPTNGLPVQTLHERRLMEDELIGQMNVTRMAMATRRERMDLMDRRGGNGHRGVR